MIFSILFIILFIVTIYWIFSLKKNKYHNYLLLNIHNNIIYINEDSSEFHKHFQSLSDFLFKLKEYNIDLNNSFIKINQFIPEINGHLLLEKYNSYIYINYFHCSESLWENFTIPIKIHIKNKEIINTQKDLTPISWNILSNLWEQQDIIYKKHNESFGNFFFPLGKKDDIYDLKIGKELLDNFQNHWFIIYNKSGKIKYISKSLQNYLKLYNILSIKDAFLDIFDLLLSKDEIIWIYKNHTYKWKIYTNNNLYFGFLSLIQNLDENLLFNNILNNINDKIIIYKNNNKIFENFLSIIIPKSDEIIDNNNFLHKIFINNLEIFIFNIQAYKTHYIQKFFPKDELVLNLLNNLHTKENFNLNDFFQLLVNELELKKKYIQLINIVQEVNINKLLVGTLFNILINFIYIEEKKYSLLNKMPIYIDETYNNINIYTKNQNHLRDQINKILIILKYYPIQIYYNYSKNDIGFVIQK